MTGGCAGSGRDGARPCHPSAPDWRSEAGRPPLAEFYAAHSHPPAVFRVRSQPPVSAATQFAAMRAGLRGADPIVRTTVGNVRVPAAPKLSGVPAGILSNARNPAAHDQGRQGYRLDS